MSLATDLQADIAELLDDPDYGRNISMRRFTPGAYNPADGSTSASTFVNFPTRGLFLKINDKLVNGTSIKRGDRRCIFKVSTIPTYLPSEGDVVVAGVDLYTVIDFDTIELAGTVVLYVLQVRK